MAAAAANSDMNVLCPRDRTVYYASRRHCAPHVKEEILANKCGVVVMNCYQHIIRSGGSFCLARILHMLRGSVYAMQIELTYV